MRLLSKIYPTYKQVKEWTYVIGPVGLMKPRKEVQVGTDGLLPVLEREPQDGTLNQKIIKEIQQRVGEETVVPGYTIFLSVFIKSSLLWYHLLT